MKKILCVMAMSTMVFATSCKKDNDTKPLIVNEPSCSTQCIDSADLEVFVVDYDTLAQSDASGNVVSINPNVDSFPTGTVFYALSRSQGVVLDSAVLDILMTPAVVLIDENGVYNFMNAQLYPTDVNFKYDKNNRTTIEIWGGNVLLATTDLSHTGLYNPLNMNYIPNTSGITNNGGHANVDVSLPSNNWYNRVCVRF